MSNDCSLVSATFYYLQFGCAAAEKGKKKKGEIKY